VRGTISQTEREVLKKSAQLFKRINAQPKTKDAQGRIPGDVGEERLAFEREAQFSIQWELENKSSDQLKKKYRNWGLK